MKPIIKFNGGYGAILCNRCRIIIKDNLTKKEMNGETTLLFCEPCLKVEWLKWLRLREITKNDEGKLCYCGHTNRCDCGDPDFTLFKESLERNTIKLNSLTNGWKKQSKRNETTDNSVD